METRIFSIYFQNLWKLEFSQYIFKIYGNYNFLNIFSKYIESIKFHKNLSNGEPSSSIRMDRWTDMMKLTVTFHNFADVPKREMCKTKKLALSYSQCSTIKQAAGSSKTPATTW